MNEEFQWNTECECWQGGKIKSLVPGWRLAESGINLMPAFKVQWVPWRSLGKNLTCVFWNLGTYLNTKDCAWRFWRTRTCWLSPGKWNKKRLCYRELKKKVRKSPPYSRFPHLSEGTERDLHVWHLACMHAKSLSRVWLFATLWTVAHQTPLSMRFSRQEYWSGFPCPSPGDLPEPGIKPESPALQTDFLPSEPPGKPHKDTPYIH